MLRWLSKELEKKKSLKLVYLFELKGKVLTLKKYYQKKLTKKQKMNLKK